MRRRPVGYILRDRKALPVYHLLQWATELGKCDRQVAVTEFINPEPWRSIDRAEAHRMEQTRIKMGMGRTIVEHMKLAVPRICVSTVFIGLDHSFGDGPPMLFETMIFNGPLKDYQRRCSTWEQAEQMHREAVEEVKKALVAATIKESNGV